MYFWTILQNVSQNVLFSSQIYHKAIFYIARGFLYQLEFLILSETKPVAFNFFVKILSNY